MTKARTTKTATRLLTQGLKADKQYDDYLLEVTEYAQLRKLSLPEAVFGFSFAGLLSFYPITSAEKDKFFTNGARYMNAEKEWLKDDLEYFSDGRENTEEDFRKRFGEKYTPEAIEIFLCEMDILVMLWRWLKEKPTKKEMMPMLNDMKRVAKSLEDIERITNKYLNNTADRNKRSAFYLGKQWLDETYLDLHKKQGTPRDHPSAAFDNFWISISWVRASIQGLINRQDSFLRSHNAKDRTTILKDSSILALASSYERCFKKKPTSTISSHGTSFLECVILMVQKQCHYFNSHNVSDEYLKKRIQSVLRLHDSK